MEADLLNTRYQEAVRSIELYLQQLTKKGVRGIQPLNKEDVSSHYGNCFSQGWEIPSLCEEQRYKLRILLPLFAPFSPPRIAVWPAPSILEWPHLEENGLLCLMSDEATHSIYNCGAVARDLLKDAINLVNASISGTNVTDFENEFESYWKRWCGTDKDKYVYTCYLPVGTSCWISSWHSQAGLFLAENEKSLLNWMEHRYGNDIRSKVTPQNIPLLWLRRPLRPKEYPKNVNMLRSILKELDVDDSMLKKLLSNTQSVHHSILLGFNTSRGIGFAGLSIGSPTTPLQKGFKNQPPENVITMRYGAAKVTGLRTIRLDTPWIHGRDQNQKVNTLLEKTVLVLGIGSIGSFVTEILAMSGVGELTLVDPENLASENASRHVLGINSINKNKALILADNLNNRFPHLKIRGYNVSCETLYASKYFDTHKPDLIISTIGSWRTEGWLNALVMAEKSPIQSPIVFGWTEPHAAAGHAIVFINKKGCLRCMSNDMGEIKIPVTSWPESGTLISVPACGGSFQPYGAIESSHIYSLVAQLAIDVLLGNIKTSTHRVWIGAKKILDTENGTWNKSWVIKYGAPNNGEFSQEINIEIDPRCPECGEQP